MKRGDIVIVDVAHIGAFGSERRPALVVQNHTLNFAFCETIIGANTRSRTLEICSCPNLIVIQGA